MFFYIFSILPLSVTLIVVLFILFFFIDSAFNFVRESLINIGKSLATPKEEKQCKHILKKGEIVTLSNPQITKQTTDKYKSLLQEAITAIKKYRANIIQSNITSEGKSILVAVEASIDAVQKIIDNTKEQSITLGVFESAYNILREQRLEIERVEKLVSLGIEDRLKQEIELLRATVR